MLIRVGKFQQKMDAVQIQNQSTDQEEIIGTSLSPFVSLPSDPYTGAESLSLSIPVMLLCSA